MNELVGKARNKFKIQACSISSAKVRRVCPNYQYELTLCLPGWQNSLLQ